MVAAAHDQPGPVCRSGESAGAWIHEEAEGLAGEVHAVAGDKPGRADREGAGGGAACMRPALQKKTCVWPLDVVLVPTIWPEALMATAVLVVPPSVPRSCIVPACQRNAWVCPLLVFDSPRMSPFALIAPANE